MYGKIVAAGPLEKATDCKTKKSKIAHKSDF